MHVYPQMERLQARIMRRNAGRDYNDLGYRLPRNRQVNRRFLHFFGATSAII